MSNNVLNLGFLIDFPKIHSQKCHLKFTEMFLETLQPVCIREFFRFIFFLGQKILQTE